MQYSFSCIPTTYDAIEATISPARLMRYLPEAKNDKHLALRLYVWNMHLCEALYLPLQMAEVASRNAIHKPVLARFGERWYQYPKFVNLLSKTMKDDLNRAVSNQRSKRGKNLHYNHMVGGLSFGFWVGLMGSSFSNHLWLNGISRSFPNAPKSEDRESIFLKLNQIRNFRNNIAHHYAIFDKRPQREFQNALLITQYICEDTRWFSGHLSNLSRVINNKPKV